jgi:hypothetical protein
MTSRKHRRYKLLLDEGVHLPQKFPNLNKRHNVFHIAQSKYRGKSDEFVFNLAEKEGRMPVVYNTKHFKSFMSLKAASVISVSTVLTDKQADLKICKALKILTPGKLKGHLIKISPRGIQINKIY